MREQGRLVVYVTTMGIVRPTYQQCQRVRQILRQLMAEFEERDLFLSVDHQQELQRRLGADRVSPPQVFIDGNLLGVSADVGGVSADVGGVSADVGGVSADRAGLSSGGALDPWG